MALFLVTAPATEPISTVVAKLHLKIDVSDDDALIDTLCAAARDYVETFTRRKCITQTWDQKRDAFPCSDVAIRLPYPPVSSVTSVSYVDTNGITQVWSTADYTTDLPTGLQARPGRIVPAYAKYYPTTRDVINAVTVRFVVGYGASASSVPSGILAAMKLLVGHWYDNREAVNVGNITTEVPIGVDALLRPFRAY